MTDSQIFIISLSFVVTLGIIWNILFFVTIFFRGIKSQLTNYLLRSQTVFDSFVCIITLLIVIFPNPVITSNPSMNYIFCHLWTSQSMFWWSVLCSIYNLVFITLDRYMAVFRPQTYRLNIKKKVYIIYTIIIGATALATIPSFFQAKYENGTCSSELEFKGRIARNVYVGYSVFWFIAVYGFPAVFMLVLYCKIMRKLKDSFKKDKSVQMQSSMRAFTKGTMINSIIFLLTVSYDALYFMLGYLDVVDYIFYSPEQRVGVFLTSINSSVNPIVFCIMVKSFRKKLVAVWCHRRCSDQTTNKVENNPDNALTSTQEKNTKTQTNF